MVKEKSKKNAVVEKEMKNYKNYKESGAAEGGKEAKGRMKATKVARKDSRKQGEYVPKMKKQKI